MMQKPPLVPRPEHPRPDFQRETYQNMNGEWEFAFDDENLGLAQRWYQPGHALPGRIVVPFCYQSKASGIGTAAYHPILWYRRRFRIKQEMAGKRILLRFGAVDYACTVYVNGMPAGFHRGGYTPFAIDITDHLAEGEQDLCLRVEDAMDCSQLRGKQFWREGLHGCWYTPVSGIWQTVYLEAVGAIAIKQVHITPDIDRQQALFELSLDAMPEEEMAVELSIFSAGQAQRRLSLDIRDRQIRIPVHMVTQADQEPIRLWSPEHPVLYDVTVRLLRHTEAIDIVYTYFGMRKIEVLKGRAWLNNSPLCQRLVLDQGYWPDTLLTPPDDESIRQDIAYTKKLGYNGARKHQKLEDPRYYYWADRMGLLVWGELPSAYDFCDETVRNLCETLLEFIDRDFNHPSIIAWVPLNESWSVPTIVSDPRQQATARMLYHLAKAADGTRLISSNDGWEQVTADICALHDYTADGRELASHFQDRRQVEDTACDWRRSYADGETPSGEEAFMVTEYGGIAFLDQESLSSSSDNISRRRRFTFFRPSPFLAYRMSL